MGGSGARLKSDILSKRKRNEGLYKIYENSFFWNTRLRPTGTGCSS